ncbi:MAG TPA: glycoside hydrolase family 16 protein [Candidatus Binatia bacterium]|jgi:beta-glucanase (GH16 family)
MTACVAAAAATAAHAFSDDFAAPLSPQWAAARTSEPGSAVSSPVADTEALDGNVLELVYPGGTSPDDSGPAFATELESASPLGYGTFRARLRTPKASRATGLVSAFFTYFNDGADHDGDGIIDNDEIDIEILANEPSSIYLTVWTDYTDDSNFHKTTRKVDVRSGRVWQTPPGGESSYDLVETDPLGWSSRTFRSWKAFATYQFVWSAGSVEYSIDLEDGTGPHVLWTLAGDPDVTIPSQPAPVFFNLWHNGYHWSSGRAARVPRGGALFHVDSVSVN